MGLVAIVGLYSSRVILDALGAEDYGIYNIAGSAVAIFSFLTGALGSSSSRFLTVELGKIKSNDYSLLTRCFTTTRGVHLILAIAIMLLAESVGAWILFHACEIPPERINAAFWVFQISIITTFFYVTVVPYNALIIAHEHMTVYAYIGIVDAVLRLFICFLIKLSPIDQLVFYAILLCSVQIICNIFCRIYCKFHFPECSFNYTLDSKFFKPILKFSGWNLLGSFATMAMTQGTTIVLSFFFGPTVIAARAIACQVRNFILNFIGNFRTAANPQILKKYAAGEIESCKRLLFLSTNISFYLMLFIAIPFLLETDFILDIWLEEVPYPTIGFTRIIILEALFLVYDLSFYMIFQAAGRLKENALLCPTLDLIGFVIIFLIYKMGGNILTVGWASLALTCAEGMVLKPLLAIKYFNYHWNDFLQIFCKNGMVFLASIILPILLYSFFPEKRNIAIHIVSILISIMGVGLSAYYLGVTNRERNLVVSFVKQHSLLHNKKKPQ